MEQEKQTMEALNEKVIQWASDKGILEKGTPIKQHDKTVEEVLELRDALVKKDFLMGNSLEPQKHTQWITINEQIKDGIGDAIVTLIIQAKMNDMDIRDCLEYAYNEIAGRTGEMVDGVFVKDGGE